MKCYAFLRYYICYSGNRELQYCASGTHWNQERQRCERPEDAQCEVMFKQLFRYAYFVVTKMLLLHQLYTTVPPTDETEDPTDETEEPTDPTEDPVIIECPDEDGIHLIPHPLICQNFFICSRNTPPLPQRCIDGLLFDALLLQCNYAADTICADGASRKISKHKQFMLNHNITSIF